MEAFHGATHPRTGCLIATLQRLRERVHTLPASRQRELLRMMRDETQLEARLRKAIADSGLTHYRLALNAGLRPHQIDRFVSGERGIGLHVAGKLAEALGLELTDRGRRKAR